MAMKKTETPKALGVTLETARKVIRAGEEKASAIGQPMNIAVVDAGANLVAFERMEGAWIGSINISINKAFTARAFDIETKALVRTPRAEISSSEFTPLTTAAS